MALATATVTMNLSDMLGTDFDTRRTKVWVSTNVPGDTVIDTVGNAIRLGTGTVTLNTDGTASVAVWKPGTGSNPASWQTYIHVDYPDAGTRTRVVRDFGPFTLTADADLADLVAEQEVPVEYASALISELQGYVDQAQAIIDSGGGGGGGTTPDATTTVKGKVELATNAETVTGTDTVRATTPAGVAAALAASVPTVADASTTVKGIVELATSGEATAGADTARAVTPAGLAAAIAATTAPRLTGLRSFDLNVPMCRSSLSSVAAGANQQSSNGTDTKGMSSLRIDLSGYLAGSIRLVYFNSTGMSADAPNPITVKAGIDRQNGGQTIGVTFDGAASVTIPVNGMAISDPIYVAAPVISGMYGVSTTPPYVRPALSGNPYSFINARTFVTVTSGQTWPLTHQCGLSGDGAESGTSITDKTTSGTVTTAGTGTYTYGPAMVLNDTPGSLPIVLGVGDSILNGTTDTSGNTGFFDRAMRAQRGTAHSLRYAQGGVIPGTPTNGSSTALAAKTKALAVLPGVTHCVYAAGINFFFNAGASLISVSDNNTNKQLMWNDWVQLADQGIKVYACTLLPYTTSTDSWATVGNQTARVNEVNRLDFNAYIRSTPSPLSGYIELADAVESARDSGKWKASHTADGLHPNTTGHAALAAVMPTTWA